jgi:hypothetical protein
MNMAFQINYSLISSPGNVRTSNQDNLIFEGKYLEAVHDGTGGVVSGRITEGGRHIFGVFDGMGGHEKGEMASYIAAKAFAEYPMLESDITIDMFNCCINANLTICKYASENKISRIGTTAVLAAVDKGYIHICNIGDSRLYICRNNEMKQLSVDHVTFAPYGRKAPLSQNLGIPETAMLIEPYTSHIKANTSDRFVLCSDGLTDMVQEAQIREIISSQKPDEAVHSLYSLAMKNGGRDNITIIVFEIINPDAMPGCGEVFKTADPFEDTQGAITPQDIESDVESSTSPVKRKSSGLMPALCAALLAFVLIAASVPLILKGMRINRTSPDKNEQTTIGEFVTLPVSELYVQTSNDFDINDSETTEITEPTIVEDGVQSIVTNEDNSEEQSKTEKEPDLQESASETDGTNDDNIIYEINADTESSDNSSKPDETGEEGEDSGVDADEQKMPEDESADNLSNEIVQKIGEDYLCENDECENHGGATVYHQKDDIQGDKSAQKCYRYKFNNNYCEECKTYYYDDNGTIVKTQKSREVRKTTKCDYTDPDHVVKIEATCTQDGKIVRLCRRCNSKSENDMEIIKALGHDWDDKSAKPVLDGDKNYYVYELTCTRCSETNTEDRYKKEREAYLKETIDSKERITAVDFHAFLIDENTSKYFAPKYIMDRFEKIYDFYKSVHIIVITEDTEDVTREDINELNDQKEQYTKLNECYKIIYGEYSKNINNILNQIEDSIDAVYKKNASQTESSGD